MKAIIYNNLGQILRVVEGPEEFLILQKQENEFVLFGEANSAIQYVNPESGEIVDKPNKPNNYCEFNWQTKQWEDDLNILIQQIKSKRQQLLQQSDWTDTVSAQTRLPNWQEWQTYRQALRDITQQSGYPEKVTWPEIPQ